MNIIVDSVRGCDMGYLTTLEMSEKWGISARRIALLCEQGRIAGVVKKGKTWLIPEEAEKPADKRKIIYMNKFKGGLI